MARRDEYFHLLVIPDLSQDCLAEIAAEMKKAPRVSTSSTNYSSVLPVTSKCTCPPHVIQAIYATCQYLKLGFDVHHLAVELFELFMIRIVKDVAEMKQSCALSPGRILATQRNMRGQVWMRLVTCILLAAKYQSNHLDLKHLRNKIVEIVSRIDPMFTAKSLDCSEMRVLRTLEFELKKPMLLSSTRVVVSSLVHNVPRLKDASHFFTRIGLLCNLASLKRRSLHSSAFRKDKKVTSHEDRLLRLSSAIIATAASVSLESNLCRKVTEELSFITHLPMEEILAVRDSFGSLIARKT